MIATYGLLTLALPFAALTLVAVQPFWTGGFSLGTMTLRNFHEAVNDPAIIDALFTSLTTSVGAIAIALPLGYVLADVLHRRRGAPAWRAVLELVTQFPLGVPAVVFGVGFLQVYTGEPFRLYGSRILIVITYVVLVLPFTVRMQLSARMAIGASYEDAARASGAGVLRAHLTVIAPMIRGALAGASVLMFVILTHEFAASLFIRSPKTQVLGTLLYDQWTQGFYPKVATISLLMSAVTAAGLLAALRIGGREALDRL